MADIFSIENFSVFLETFKTSPLLGLWFIGIFVALTVFPIVGITTLCFYFFRKYKNKYVSKIYLYLGLTLIVCFFIIALWPIRK